MKRIIFLIVMILCMNCISCNIEKDEFETITKNVVFYNGEKGLYLEPAISQIELPSMTRNAGSVGCWDEDVSEILSGNKKDDGTLYAFEVGLRKNHLSDIDKDSNEIEKVKKGFLAEGFYIVENHNYICSENDFVIAGTLEDYVRVFGAKDVEMIAGWSCWANPASRPDWENVKEEEMNNPSGRSILLEVSIISP